MQMWVNGLMPILGDDAMRKKKLAKNSILFSNQIIFAPIDFIFPSSTSASNYLPGMMILMLLRVTHALVEGQYHRIGFNFPQKRHSSSCFVSKKRLDDKRQKKTPKAALIPCCVLFV
jgi:hypothetical protein